MFQAAKNFVGKSVDVIENNTGAVVGAVGTGLMTVGSTAMAALPTEATAAFTTLSGNVTDIFAAIWPVLAAVVGGFVLIKLFKRGTSAAV